MFFVQEDDKPNIIFNKLNILKIEQDKIILPVTNEQIKSIQAKKLATKVNKILNQSNCKKIVLSKKMQRNEFFLNYLNSNNIEIIDGRWLFEILLEDIVEYIINKKKLNKSETQISILINNFNEIGLYNINKIVKKYKKTNIITNHIEKLRNIEKEFSENEGIILTITNNKRKSLAKSKIILNIDFPQELINQYNIYEEAIIVNIQGNIKINKKRFNGMCINNYEINPSKNNDFDYDKENKYYKKDVYTATLYKKQPIENILKKIKKDKVEITELIGENNKI